MNFSGAAFAILGLTLWHGSLISWAQTSIEVHINGKERKRCKALGKVFHNPYNFGFIRNWKLFLGLAEGRSFRRHVLLPSTHKPLEDGITWKTSTYSVKIPFNV